MTQVLDFLWGSIQYEDFCVYGANWDRPVGSPTAWKIKRPRPVAVLIPGYNICKICDDASLSYFRRIFWKSLFRHFPDSLDVGFGGGGGLTLVPYGLPGPNGDTKLLIWPLPLMYVKTAMTQVLDFVLRSKLYIRLLISFINDEGSTGPPTAWPNQAIVAFDRPYPGVQYIQKLRWRKS